jgi:hypothetical protein
MKSQGASSAPRACEPPDLRRRLALRPREAAAALGVSERVLRQLAPELPRIVRRGIVLYPVRALEEALARLATREPLVPRLTGEDEPARIARRVLERLGR